MVVDLQLPVQSVPITTKVVHGEEYSIQLYVIKLVSDLSCINTLVHTFWVGFMVFNATFKSISVILWQSVLLVEEFEVPGETH
jgi:hypothetical protein